MGDGITILLSCLTIGLTFGTCVTSERRQWDMVGALAVTLAFCAFCLWINR